MARAKICGINDPAAMDAAIEAGADWIGFVFFSASPRFVTPAQARALSKRHRGGPPTVGLFVSPDPAEIAAALAEIPLDILQIHGDTGGLRARFGLPVWRAVGIAAKPDLPLTLDGADMLLLDAKPPPGATRPGGNAVRFDWTLTAGWTPPGPWILAGGLDPDNVASAIHQSGADAVDVSSGVERARGVKDTALIHAFVANAHAA